ncbi:interferon-inducible GTPase-domain-containing protein [Endogone sp. FLAS-F59071]|nr:interferon-inducible GTPase-domain-containing protein [Endogone sp. FLAS-F59071]|eukprot:RUS18606.1 interferon-inducible GTPase-domain-containing protein [Endogone sp. FLAS-F59071]
MGNEQSKRKTPGQNLEFAAKAAGTAVASILVSPFAIVAAPFVTPYMLASENRNSTRLRIASDVILGVISGALIAPFLPLALPIIGVSALLNKTPSRPGVSDAVCKEAFEKFGIDCRDHYNIAIVGASGQGKSSLLNGLMGVSDGDENAAEVGEVETTLNLKGYSHPMLKTVVLWDLPGGGTPKNPAETYFKDNMLHAFDALVVLDLDIAKQAAEAEVPVPVFFVRSKADKAIESKRRKNKNITWEQAAEKLQQEVRKSIQGQLEEAMLAPGRLFVVSAWSLQEVVQMIEKEESSQELKLMDEIALISMLMEETISRRT